MHFTHVNNLPSIVAADALHADCSIRARCVAIHECGDREIKERRRHTPVRVPPRGVVGEYVPFYFAPRSPMLYKIWRGGVPTYQEGQEPLVYLVSSLKTVDEHGLTWVGSDGNFAAPISEHTTDWARLEEIVDWPLMKERYWSDTEEDGDRMRRRMAELLVHKVFPLKSVEYLVAKTRSVASVASRHIQGRIPVNVRDSWYY